MITPVHTSPYASTGNGTIHTCPISPTPQAGRLLTATVATSQPSPTIIGWTQITDSKDIDSAELAQYWRWSTGTETSLVATTSFAGPACITVTEWSGLTNVGPDVADSFGNPTTSNPNSGTTAALAASGELVVVAFAETVTLPQTAPVFTPPAGYTLLGHLRTSNAVGLTVDLAVCYTLAATAAAQTATASYDAPQANMGGNIVAYLEASTLGAGQLYPKFKEALLTQSPDINCTSDTVRAAIGRVSDGFTFDPADQFFSDVEVVMVTNYAASVIVSGLATFMFVLVPLSPHIQFNVTTGAELDFLILFDDQGSAAASPLIAYLPLSSPVLPVAGKVVQVDWDTGTRAMQGILRI